MPSETLELNKLVNRYEWESYIEVGDKNELMGDGFTSLKESKNPQEYTRKYVNNKSETTDVTGFSPSIDYALDVYSESPVISVFVKICDDELIGTDAQVTITNVNRWQVDDAGKCTAYQRKYAVIPSDKGDGTSALNYNGTMKSAGDVVKGTFDLDTKKFAAVAEV